MNGLEIIAKYHDAKKTIDKFYDVCKWVVDKLGPLYISHSGYYTFDDITLCGDRYKIEMQWHTDCETTYEEITVPKDLCEQLFAKDTREAAYAELKRIHDAEMEIRKAEQKAQWEKARAEQAERDRKRRLAQYEELKKEFG